MAGLWTIPKLVGLWQPGLPTLDSYPKKIPRPSSLDWFKGKIMGTTHISWEKLWFPVDFPLNQSNDFHQKKPPSGGSLLRLLQGPVAAAADLWCPGWCGAAAGAAALRQSFHHGRVGQRALLGMEAPVFFPRTIAGNTWMEIELVNHWCFWDNSKKRMMLKYVEMYDLKLKMVVCHGYTL